MISVRMLPGLLLLLAAGLAYADTETTLTDDVYADWKNGTDAHVRSGTCGFMIIGNHLSKKNPRVEWSINIDEVYKGEDRSVVVTANSFDVADGARVPRTPVTAISFSFEGAPEPIAAQISGDPDPDNAVRGSLELAKAQPLFDALTEDKWITIALKYADATSETLKTKGFKERFHTGKSSAFYTCLAGKKPYDELRRPTY